MKLIKPSELARRAGTSREAVRQLMVKGNLPAVLSGKRKMIDADDPIVIEYINLDHETRRGVRTEPSEKPPKIPPESTTPSETPDEKPEKPPTTSEVKSLEITEMIRRAKFAEMRKRELQVLVMEKKFLPIEFSDGVYVKALEDFNSLMERFAATYIRDVGKKILDAGEIKAEHIEEFTAFILTAIHNNKKDLGKKLEKYEPRL